MGMFDFLFQGQNGGLLPQQAQATPPGQPTFQAGLQSGANGLLDFFQNNPTLVSSLASGLLSSPNLRSALGNAAGMMPQARQADIKLQGQNALRDFFKNPENAKAVPPNMLPLLQKNPDLASAYLSASVLPHMPVAVPAGGALVDPITGKSVYQGAQGSFLSPPGGGAGGTPGTAGASGNGGAPQGGGAFVRDVNGNIQWQGPQYLGPPQENEFDKTLGASQAKTAQGVTDAGDKAGADLQKANLIGQLMDQVQTGKLAPGVATVGAWLQSVGLDPGFFGIDPKLPANAQALSGLANAMILGKIGSASGGFPANNFSEQDRNFLLTTIPQLSQQPGASRLLLEVNKRLDQLAISQANAWDDARAKGVSWQQFDHEWRSNLTKQNIFGDIMAQVGAVGGASSYGPGIDALIKKYAP